MASATNYLFANMPSVPTYYLILATILSMHIFALKYNDKVHTNELCNLTSFDNYTLLSKRAITRQKDLIWPRAIIPYDISGEFAILSGDDLCIDEKQQLDIKKSIEAWMAQTCVQFIPHTDEIDYVKFIKVSSKFKCHSQVGRRGGGQPIILGDGCFRYSPIIVHEIGHLLGLWHMHTRPDRDQYIEILWDNIDDQNKHLFHVHPRAEVQSFCMPYDFDSIMQYPLDIFSKNEKPTMKLKVEHDGEIGVWKKPSDGDNQQIRYLYGCEKLPKTCMEGSGSGFAAVTLSGDHIPEWELPQPSAVTLPSGDHIAEWEQPQPSHPTENAPEHDTAAINSTSLTSSHAESSLVSLTPSIIESSNLIKSTPTFGYIHTGSPLGFKLDADDPIKSRAWVECEKQCKVTVCPGPEFPPKRKEHCPHSQLSLLKADGSNSSHIRSGDRVVLVNYINKTQGKIVRCGSNKCYFKQQNCRFPLTKLCQRHVIKVTVRGKKKGEIVKPNDIVALEMNDLRKNEKRSWMSCDFNTRKCKKKKCTSLPCEELDYFIINKLEWS